MSPTDTHIHTQRREAHCTETNASRLRGGSQFFEDVVMIIDTPCAGNPPSPLEKTHCAREGPLFWYVCWGDANLLKGLLICLDQIPIVRIMPSCSDGLYVIIRPCAERRPYVLRPCLLSTSGLRELLQGQIQKSYGGVVSQKRSYFSKKILTFIPHVTFHIICLVCHS